MGEVPLRLEIGPRDIQEVMFLLERYRQKITVKMEGCNKEIKDYQRRYSEESFDIAKKRMDRKYCRVENYDEFKKAIEDRKFVLGYWAGSSDD